MSINVTVHSNPISIRRGKMLLADPEDLKKNEFNRRRKLRLQQVRQQSTDLANRLREQVKNEKGKQQSEFEKEQLSEMKKRQARKLLDLQQKYQDCLEEVGMGHKEAALQPDYETLLRAEQNRNVANAHRRGRDAAERARQEEAIVREEREARLQQHKLSRTVEDLRSVMVSSIGKRQPKTKATKPLQAIDHNVIGIDAHETVIKTVRPSKLKTIAKKKVSKTHKKIPPLYGLNDNEGICNEIRDLNQTTLEKEENSGGEIIPPLIRICDSEKDEDETRGESSALSSRLQAERNQEFFVSRSVQTFDIEQEKDGSVDTVLPYFKVTKHISGRESRISTKECVRLKSAALTSESGLQDPVSDAARRAVRDESSTSTSSSDLPRPGPLLTLDINKPLSMRTKPGTYRSQIASPCRKTTALPDQDSPSREVHEIYHKKHACSSGRSETYRTTIAEPCEWAQTLCTRCVNSSLPSKSSHTCLANSCIHSSDNHKQPLDSFAQLPTHSLAQTDYLSRLHHHFPNRVNTSLNSSLNYTEPTNPPPSFQSHSHLSRPGKLQPETYQVKATDHTSAHHTRPVSPTVLSRSTNHDQDHIDPLTRHKTHHSKPGDSSVQFGTHRVPSEPDTRHSPSGPLSDAVKSHQHTGTHHGGLRSRLVTVTTEETSDSDCYCAEVPSQGRLFPSQPNTSVTSLSRPVVPPSSSRVQFYDHSARYHREYETASMVERLSPRDINAAQMAQFELQKEGAPAQQLRSETARASQRAKRGNRAMERERVHRDYRQLFDQLGRLSREERLLRSSQTRGLRLDIHQPDERRKLRQATRQQNMDSVFERVFHSTRQEDDDVGSATISTRIESRTSFSTFQPEPVEKLNVAQHHQFDIPPLPMEVEPTPAPQPPEAFDLSSPSSSYSSIVVGHLPPGATFNAVPQSAQQPATLESLLQRVNVQRSLLLQEIGQDLDTLDPLPPMSSEATSLKRPANRDVSFSSDSSSSQSDKGVTDSGVAGKSASSKDTETFRLPKGIMITPQEVPNQSGVTATNDVLSVNGNVLRFAESERTGTSKAVMTNKRDKHSSENVREKNGDQTNEVSKKHLLPQSGQERKEKEADVQEEGIPEESNRGEGVSKKRHKEGRSSKRTKSEKQKREKERHDGNTGQNKTQENNGDLKKRCVETSLTTVVSEYSMDMSLSKTEHNTSRRVSGADSSHGSSSSTFEGVKIIVSVIEKAQTQKQVHNEESAGQVPSITDGKHKPRIKAHGFEVTGGSKPDRDSESLKNPTREDKYKTRHSKAQLVIHTSKNQKKNKLVSSSKGFISVSGDRPKLQKAGGKEHESPDTANVRKRQVEENLAWHHRLKHKGNISDPSTSTSYHSPPEEVSTTHSEVFSTLLATIDKVKLNVLKSKLRRRLNNITTGQSKSKHPFDPVLARYINRLLRMSNEGIEELQVDVSDVPTPPSSVVNDSDNLDDDVDEEEEHIIDAILQGRIKQLSQELAELDEYADKEQELAALKLISDKMKEERSKKKPKGIDKDNVDEIKFRDRRKSAKNDPKTTKIPNIPRSEQARHKYVSESSVTDTTLESSVVMDKDVLHKPKPRKVVQLPAAPQDTLSSVIHTRHGKFQIPSPIPHEEPVTERTHSDQPGLFQPIKTSDDKRAAQTVSHVPQIGREGQYEETPVGRPREVREKFEGLAKKCSERINSLAQMIDQVRIEKQNLLNHSPGSSANSSARGEMYDSTRYESPPTVVEQPQDVAPPLKVPPCQLSPPSSSDQSHSPDTAAPPGLWVSERVPNVISDGIVTIPTSLVARTVFLTEPLDIDNPLAPEKTKPPASLWRNILRNDIPVTMAHELSTILEVDTLPSQSITDTATRTLTSEVHEKAASPTTTAMPDVMTEMMRRRLITSPLPFVVNAETAPDSDTSTDGQNFYPSLLTHKAPGSRSTASTDHSHSPVEERVQQNSPVGRPPPISFGPPSPWLVSSKETTLESQPNESSNDTESTAEDLDGTFKKLGLGWAGATLRKTQETRDLSSSSSDLSQAQTGRPPTLLKSNGSKVKTDTSIVQSDNTSTTVGLSSPNDEIFMQPRRHSTPIKHTSDSSNSIDNTRTGESFGRTTYFSVSGGSEASVTRSHSSEEQLWVLSKTKQDSSSKQADKSRDNDK